MTVSTSGFALRANGTCASNQEDCGATVSPYRVCCPKKSFCPTSYNVDCCPTSANCTVTLLKNPQCANTSWDLYDNGGYFCCLPGYTGYAATLTGSNGCAAPGYEFGSGEKLLALISAGETATSSVSSAQTSSSSVATTTSLSSSSTTTAASSSSELGAEAGLSGGAIAGIVVGVVGGIAVALVIAWLLWRRRKRSSAGSGGPANEMPDTSQYPHHNPPQYPHHHPQQPAFAKSAELDGQYSRTELDASPQPVELYAPPEGPGELDGAGIPRQRV